MGCGCKNNQQAPIQQVKGANQTQPVNTTQQQSVKESIKKTIAKYYNVNKG
jgi:hypothetical protein